MVILCQHEGCTKMPTFNIKGYKALFCATHKTADMVDVKHRMCFHDNCDSRPTFDIKGGKGRFCSKHKTAEMIDVMNRYCEIDGCEIINPVFDIGGGKGRFCSKHKLSNMIDIRNKRCEYDNCNSQSSFDIQGGKGRFCSKHKTSEMINISIKHCEHNNCRIRASFDIKGGNGRFCKTHKTDEMINVVSKRCEQEGCDLQPSFDVEGGKGRFCSKHKTYEMIDVIHRRCERKGCNVLNPVFDIEGGKGRFCKEHKTDEMIDVKNKRCESNGCKSQSSNFDIKGGKGRFCSKHKTAEMINVNSKKCEYFDCDNYAYYGKPGHKKSYCLQHRQHGMIRNSTARCSECNNLAIWGINWIPLHCDLHKTENDDNLVEQQCKSCNLMYILDKNNLCELCNPSSFITSRLAKQTALMAYLDNRGLNGISTDKMVDNGICGKERPDRVYDFGNKIIVLECDENQHQERACICEQTRMINIGQSFGGIPVYFIRWNPDNYSPENNKKKSEILSKRHKLCGDLINDIKNNKINLPIALVSVIYLYYDGWSSLSDEKWKVILSFN